MGREETEVKYFMRGLSVLQLVREETSQVVEEVECQRSIRLQGEKQKIPMVMRYDVIIWS